MIFHGRINRTEKLTLDDGGVLHQLSMTDASRPVSLRSSGDFVTYISEEVRKRFPSGEEIYDSEITVVIREIGSGRGGSVKVKGDCQPGHLPVEKFTTQGGALPQKPKAA